MGDRAEPCPTPTLMLWMGEEKLFHKYVVFLLTRYFLKKFETLILNPAFSSINRRIWWFRDRKNWVMLNAKVLVVRFLTYPVLIKWVRATPASVVDLCLSPPNWHWWTKLLEIEWNWRRSPIIFSNNFPRVLRKTMGRKDLGMS